ncbi:MFS transporter [bacterium 210820-DFI.6.37]|nr:MFS transporter [bacterium 210820-DFI.6.37]
MGKIKLKGENGKIYFGWFIIIMCLLLMAFGYSCAVSIVGVFVLPVTEDLGIQIGDFVIWTTIMSLTSILYLTIFSKFYNVKTIKPIMTVCALLGAVGFFGFSRATELWHFYLFAIPMGICFGGLTATPSSVLVNNWFGPKCRGLAMALVFSGTSVVCMGLIPLVNYIVAASGWRTAYLFICLGLIVICVPMILLFAVWSPAQKGLKQMGETENIPAAEDSAKRSGIAFKDGIKRPSTWLFFISGALIVLGSAAMLTHTQTFLIMTGYSPVFAANVMSAMVGALVIGGILVGAFCDRYKLRIAAAGSCLIFAVAYGVQIFIPQASWLIVVLIVGYGLGCTAVNIVPPIIANFMFGDREITGYIGYINIFIGIGGAFGSTMVGKLLDLTGSYTVPFLICTVMMLAAAIIRGVVTSEKYHFKG